MQTFLNALFTGGSRGAIYALVALGLVLVWRGAGLINFAQMGQAMFSAYVASTLIAKGYNYWIAFFAALIVGALLGAAIDILVIRPLKKKSGTAILGSPSMRDAIPVIASLGILGILQSVAGMIWAGSERGFPAPVSTVALKVNNNTMPFTYFDLFTIAIVILILIATSLFLSRTSVGLAMRASALNSEVARLSGIRTRSIRTLGWVISGAVASVAGLLVTPATNISPNSLDLILIIGFTACVIGGLDSLLGSVVGGFLLGFVIAFISVYDIPEDIFIAIFLILMGIMFLRPQGLFGSEVGRRV